MRGYTLIGLTSLLVLELGLGLRPSLHSVVQGNGQGNEIHASLNSRPAPVPYRGSGRRTTALLIDSDFQYL